MSTDSPLPKKRHSAQYLTIAEKQAIVAACASGQRKGAVAEAFGILPQALSRILRVVKNVENPLNPLSARKDLRQTVVAESYVAVRSGLKYKQNPYRRADIGIKCLYGLGEFTSTQQIDQDTRIEVSWAGASEVIDIVAEPNTLNASNDGHAESFAPQSDTPQIDTKK